MQDSRTELSVSNEVLEKMAEIAACEIEGVTLSKRAVDIKDVIRTKSAFKGVIVENAGGTVKLTIYICVKNNIEVRNASEAVQKNVKEKLQTMTGTVVTRVDVKVVDVAVENAQ